MTGYQALSATTLRMTGFKGLSATTLRMKGHEAYQQPGASLRGSQSLSNLDDGLDQNSADRDEESGHHSARGQPACPVDQVNSGKRQRIPSRKFEDHAFRSAGFGSAERPHHGLVEPPVIQDSHRRSQRESSRGARASAQQRGEGPHQGYSRHPLREARLSSRRVR